MTFSSSRARRVLRTAAAGAVASLALLAAAGPAAAAVAPANPWLERRVLNIAHQGGEVEAPSNTLFAFKTARDKGADVLELDVHATGDGHLVVLHDATVNRTTNGAGRVDQMTLEDIKALDAAYWFVPDCGTCRDEPEDAYVYRGYATGRELPEELSDYEANDFRIPTLREVLDTFPRSFINIEIKATAPETEAYEEDLARLLAEFNRGSDTIVVSFNDVALERFKLHARNVSTATGTGQTAAFWASAQGPLPGAPNPRYQALQVPIEFNKVKVVTREFVQRAHDNALAVHVWTIDDARTMKWLIEIGVDGIMTNRPTLLEQVLEETGAGYRPGPHRAERARGHRGAAANGGRVA